MVNEFLQKGDFFPSIVLGVDSAVGLRRHVAFTDDQDAITKSGVVWVEICNSKSGTEKLIKEKPCELYNNFINF